MASVREEDAGADQVLAAERDHLATSRDFLRLMREDVMSLPALAGDRVSQEYLKADLYRRAESLKDLPDTPLFFGRLDYEPGRTRPATEPGESTELTTPGAETGESFHIGRRHVHDPHGHPGRDRLAGAGVQAVLPSQPQRSDGPPQAAPVRVQRW